MPMRNPEEYWQETSDERLARIARQDDDRAYCANDWMELIYTEDLDEIFAELLRLHGIVGDPRTDEIVRRTLPERIAKYENAAA